MTVAEKREKITKLVLDTCKVIHGGVIDPNYKRLKAQFDLMSDKDFMEWANWCGQELDHTIQMYEEPFKDVKLEDLEKAAKHIGIELEEYVYYYDKNKDGLRTATKVPVGVLHIKRMQQLLSKKNRYTLDNSKVSLMTGQVTGESKVAAISDAEATAVLSWDADKVLAELYGPRSGSQKMKQEMYKRIANDGYVTLADLKEVDDNESHSASQTINIHLLASGIRSDLVSNNLKTPYTVRLESELIKR